MRAHLIVSFVFVCLVVFATSSTAEEGRPLVSVIVPTYQRPAFLTHALELIRTQDYPNIEIIVVDDSPEPSISASVVVGFSF